MEHSLMASINKYILVILLGVMSCAGYAQETLMLKLEVSNTNYSLLDSWVLPRLFPATANIDRASEGAVNWVITSVDDTVLANGIIPDPQVIRAHLLEEGKLSLKNSRLEKTNIIIRVPYDKNMQKLIIERTPIIYLPSESKAEPNKMQKLDNTKHSFLIAPRSIQ